MIKHFHYACYCSLKVLYFCTSYSCSISIAVHLLSSLNVCVFLQIANIPKGRLHFWFFKFLFKGQMFFWYSYFYKPVRRWSRSILYDLHQSQEWSPHLVWGSLKNLLKGPSGARSESACFCTWEVQMFVTILCLKILKTYVHIWWWSLQKILVFWLCQWAS